MSEINTPTVTVKAPSNIALIKYWGKSDSKLQWPANSSISMTLENATTTTSVSVQPSSEHLVQVGGIPWHRKLQPSLFAFLDQLAVYYGLEESSRFRVRSQNSFPMGCGIASSASGYAALTLAIFQLLDPRASRGQVPPDIINRTRMGSGSACRSLFGGFVLWERGMDPHNQRVQQILDPRSWRLADTIVITDAEPKKISSRDGHSTAFTSPLMPSRLAGLPGRLKSVMGAIHRQDLSTLGPLMEADALEMHAVMMSAKPPLRYFGTEVGEFLGWWRQLRRRQKLSAFFTLDAGPNIHIISSLEDRPRVVEAVRERLGDIRILADETGLGPQLITGAEKNTCVPDPSELDSHQTSQQTL